MTYRLIDHTADVGLHIFGSNLKDLFANAAHAMYDVITEPTLLEGADEHEIRVTGDDWPDLMVNWLREALYLWSGRELLVKQVHILSLSEYELTAKVKADPYNPDRHSLKKELKAVTYYQIQVYEGEKGWEAEVVFDV